MRKQGILAYLVEDHKRGEKCSINFQEATPKWVATNFKLVIICLYDKGE
jgi:hypothetical protein